MDEMIGAVEGARGALPLLAFAVSRLWEKRKPEEKLLTREAYQRIGGVAGALAQHAEETMDRIGGSMEPTVRDIFRNLTTAQGTRAVLDREELLSALPDRAAAEAVLGKLIDARLLTSWETEGTEGQPPQHRVEIVHESLLSAWPRLVRWQTQDADGAQLRDQLRQAAHLWEERGRADDLLWTGSSYLDYRVWRGRYPGKLSALEEDFAGSMKARAERARRRRRTAFGSVGVALLAVACVMAVLWNQARVHGVRAEAARLLAMAQLEVDVDPTAALAYATKSVELEDTEAARFFALRVTQSAPVANVVTQGAEYQRGYPFCRWFSPDGEWLAVLKGKKILLQNQDGRAPVTISPGEFSEGTLRGLAFGPDNKVLSVGFREEVRSLSVPDGREIRRVKYEAVGPWWPHAGVAMRREGSRRTFFARPLDGGDQQVIGALESSETVAWLDVTGELLAYAVGKNVYARPLAQPAYSPRLIGEHSTAVTEVSLSEDGRQLAAVDKSGEVRIWDTASASGRPLQVFPAPALMAPAGKNSVKYMAPWIVSDSAAEGHASLRLWDLTGPPGAGPVVLRSRSGQISNWGMDPLGRGLTGAEDGGRLLFWHLPRSRPRVFDWREGLIWSIAFTPDGTTLVAATNVGGLRAWPLSAGSDIAFRILPNANDPLARIAASPIRREIAVGAPGGRVQVVPVDGGEPRVLEGPPNRATGWVGAFSPDGRRLAAGPLQGPATEKRIRVWDLETGALQVLEPVSKADDAFEGGFQQVSFAGNDRIVATPNGNGLMLFDLRSGKATVLSSSTVSADFAVGRRGRVGIGTEWDGTSLSGGIFRFGLDGSAPVPLPFRWEAGTPVAIDPTEAFAAFTGPADSIRIYPISGGEPHLLFGHKGEISALAFSPNGKWLASAGADQTVRLWPVPDMTKVPPHKRSKEEFLSTLRTFTNLRAVPDPKSPNGWKLEAGPFPGWKDAPHW